MDYSIKINEFVGPLDLLLHLVKISNIDIYNQTIKYGYIRYRNK